MSWDDFDADFAFDAWADERARRPGDGKRAEAPCGCEGEVIVGTYVRCLKHDASDGVPEHVEPESTRPICPNALDVFSSVKCDGNYPVRPWGVEFICPDTGRVLWHCDGCGLDFRS